MRDFFVPKDLLLFSNGMGMNSDFSVRGFSAGVSEASATLMVTVSSSVAVPWDFDQLTTALWLDRADGSTFTLDVSLVNQWRDKSGNNRHGSASGSARPSVSNTAVVFNGTSQDMALANITTLNYVNATAFIVAKRDNSAGRAEISFALGQYSTAKGICDVPKWTDNKMYSQVGTNANRPSPTSVITNGRYMNVIVGGSQQKVYTNGLFIGAGTTQPTADYVTESGYVGSGRAHSASIRFFDGDIHEIVICNGVLSDADRQKGEGRLAHKWDGLLGVTTLVDALPSDHPYKSAAPTL